MNVALPDDAVLTNALDRMAASLNVTRAEAVEAILLATASAWRGEPVEQWHLSDVSDDELNDFLGLDMADYPPAGPVGAQWWGREAPAGFLADVRARAWRTGQRNKRARAEAAREAGRSSHSRRGSVPRRRPDTI